MPDTAPAGIAGQLAPLLGRLAAKASAPVKVLPVLPTEATQEEVQALLQEARQIIAEALAADGVRDTDARLFVGAIAAALAVMEVHERRRETVLSDLVQQAQTGTSPAERQALRAEVVKAAMGALPGPEERVLFAKQIVAAIRESLPEPPPPISIEALVQAVRESAKEGAQAGGERIMLQARAAEAPAPPSRAITKRDAIIAGASVVVTAFLFLLTR